ncbi:unnamed protein product, partial [Ectocarpus sp. 6 AP-2014]
HPTYYAVLPEIRSSSLRRRRMEMLLILLLGLSALWGTDEVNPCLDPTDASYSCELSDDTLEPGRLSLGSCGIGDEDFDDLVSCLDAAGRQEIVLL